MSRAGRAALHLAFLASGLTALLYQVLWSRYLTLFVGGTSVAHTIVLATFMSGLAFGNWFFGRRADGPAVNRLRLYALLEVGIGLCCLSFPLLFERLCELYLSLARVNGPGAWVNDVLKVALSAASMFVPCALMGGTLPVLARYVVDSMSNLGVKLSWLYFVNTAGAVLGCLLGGFYVVEVFGLETGMVGAALVNLVIGAAFYVAGRRPQAEAAPEADAGPARSEEPAYTATQAEVAFWCIAVAGGVSMLYELCWTRVLTLSMGSSVHSFSTMLVSFISGIAIGSAVVARLQRRPRNALLLFALCEVGVALSILVPLPWYERLPYAFHRLGTLLAHAPDTYPLYLAGQVLTAALVMFVPTTLIGAALPLASRVCVERVEVVGRRVGGVFSANTVGTVVGAVFTGFVLLPRLGLEQTLRLGCAVSAALGVVLLWAWRPARARWLPAAAGLGALVLVGVLGPGWDPRLMQAGLFRWGSTAHFPSWSVFRGLALRDPFIYSRDGMDGTISVQKVSETSLNLRVNGKVDASVDDMATQLMVGHIPMFMHPRPQRAMVVGLGCGATAAAVLRHPGVTADVAEISPEMVEAARYFGPWNDGVLQNPRLSLHVIDAREFLLLTGQRYDVIVSEPTNVWVPGVANLFTRDFYRVVHSRLQPGGLFAQWMQVYSAEPAMVASVVASVRAEFPYVSAWLVKETDLILLAGDARPPFDPDQFAARLEAMKPVDGLPSPPRSTLGMFLHPSLFLAHQVGSSQGLEVSWPSRRAPLYRDLRPRLEFQAARSQFVGENFKVREQLDERLTRWGAELLFVEDYLRRRPLDGRGRMALAEVLGALPAFPAELTAAVRAGAMLDGGVDPQRLAALPDALLARMTLAGRLGEEIDRRPQPDASLCAAYLEAEGSLLRAAGSVFGRPAAAGLKARAERCLGAAPPGQAGTLRASVAFALAQAGDEGALPAIGILLREGALQRLPPRSAADLLMAGAVVLLQQGRREEAATLAEHALGFAPHDPGALRVVWAIKPERAAAIEARAATTAPPS
jgi:spermidine synthase